MIEEEQRPSGKVSLKIQIKISSSVRFETAGAQLYQACDNACHPKVRSSVLMGSTVGEPGQLSLQLIVLRREICAPEEWEEAAEELQASRNRLIACIRKSLPDATIE